MRMIGSQLGADREKQQECAYSPRNDMVHTLAAGQLNNRSHSF
jgi:hypothetical protein